MISLEGMKFFAFHGCSIDEKQVGINFEVDVFIDCDIRTPASTDDINNALNYQKVYEIVSEQMKIASNLIENVALRIKEEILKIFPFVDNVSVKVSKINPPLGGQVERVSVTI